MRVLGAVLHTQAGRGSGNEARGEQIREALVRQCTAVCVVAADPAGSEAALRPWPRDGVGPLGLIAAALRHARDLGLPFVLSCPADAAHPPAGLLPRLVPAPAHAVDAALVGLWRVADIAHIDLLIADERSHDVSGFAALCGARAVVVRRQT